MVKDPKIRATTVISGVNTYRIIAKNRKGETVDIIETTSLFYAARWCAVFLLESKNISAEIIWFYDEEA